MSISPERMAYLVASCTLLMPNFRKIFLRCVLTVWKLRFFSAAISLVVLPAAISFSIMRSCLVSITFEASDCLFRSVSKRLEISLQMNRVPSVAYCMANRISVSLESLLTREKWLFKVMERRKSRLRSSEKRIKRASRNVEKGWPIPRSC